MLDSKKECEVWFSRSPCAEDKRFLASNHSIALHWLWQELSMMKATFKWVYDKLSYAEIAVLEVQYS
jgi:hypothetical protein